MIFNTELSVPTWANFVGLNPDGTIYAFADKPFEHPCSEYWQVATNGGQFACLHKPFKAPLLPVKRELRAVTI